MRKITSNPPPTIETLFLSQKDPPCNGVQNISIIVHKRRLHHNKKRRKTNHAAKESIGVPRLNKCLMKNKSQVSKRSSMPECINDFTKVKLKRSCSDTIVKKSPRPSYNSKFFVNVVSEFQHPDSFNPFCNPVAQVKWRVYRCQLSTQDESCCCSCNSDAMFEVMKSLYDCYKKKNCDHCNCILCGHMPREERKLGELRKSGAALSTVGVETDKQKAEKQKTFEKTKKAAKSMVGKSPAEKEKILTDLAMSGAPLPEGKTASEKELIKKVKTQVGLPPEPKTAAEKDKLKKAEAAGIITPLEGKTTAQKEKILEQQAKAGIPLPEGRTASEKALIQKVKTAIGVPSKAKVPSEKLRKAKTAGFLTPLEGKSPEQKEKILKGLAMSGVPLPEGKTASEKKLIDKVRTEVGLPPEPKSSADKKKYQQALASGIVTPLEGKSKAQKEKILKSQVEAGVPLPEGRTASEKALIAKVKAETKRAPSAVAVQSEKLRKAKAAGFLTPLEGKSPEQKEKILKGLAMSGVPLPEGKTASEKKLIDKVRTEVGLPPEPKSSADKKKYQQALASGIVTPLEGKSKAQKEKILKSQVEAGVPLPEGRTASEKALIAKVKAETKRAPSAVAVQSEKLRKAKAAGFLTPLEGKSPEQKEKILKGLAMSGVPLPEGKTASEKKLIDKVRTEVGLPPEPKSSADKKKYQQAMASGIITPLEGKSKAQKEKILRSQAEAGLPLPEGRTASDKALIAKVKATAKPPSEGAPTKKIAGSPSEKLRKAKAAGLITPLEGKSADQKEKILKGLAMNGVPLPEGKTASEKKLIEKVRNDVGLPPEPKTASEKEKYAKAFASGLVTPLEGKSTAQQEKILKGQLDMGLPLPEGRTASEKALIQKVKAAGGERKKSKTRGVTAGGPALPPEKAKILDEKTAKVMKEGKGPSDECICGLLTPESERVSVGKAAPVKLPSEKLKAAKAAGLLTPLTGKSPEQKEKILKGLAKQGIPLPEGKTASEKKIIDKVRAELGLPPEPKTPSIKEKYAKSQAQGIITPLEGKSPAQKEKILKAQADAGLPLPEGRTASEKALISKVKATAGAPTVAKIPSEKLRKAKAAGLLTPLTGKSPEQKEKILKGLAKQGIPLPEGKTASEKKIIDKVRAELGLPPEPKTPSIKEKYAKSQAQGIITPLEGKSPAQKEKILKAQADAGLPLPEGRTASEKALISKVKATAGAPTVAKIPSEKLRKAKAAGLLTPLTGKSPEQKEKILKGLATHGIPLPEAKTASEKKIIDKVRADLGMPPEPKSASMKEKYAKAQAQGIMTPLEGKTPTQKENILKAQAEAGIALPEGRTPSEKALISKVKAAVKGPSSAVEVGKIPSEKLRKAKAAGLLTPLEGKTPAQKEKILKGQLEMGLPLPEGRTASEKALIQKVAGGERKKSKTRGVTAGGPALPPEKAKKLDEKTAKVMKEGKGPSDECICGLLTPESERVSVGKAAPVKLPSEKLKAAKAAGLLTPLTGKSPEQKEKILKGLAKQGIPLPEGKTASEKKIIDKVRAELGLPPEPKTPSIKEKYAKSQAQGIITPLEGKSPAQKEKILKAQADAGLPLPEGRTASEKALISKVKATAGAPTVAKIPSEKLRKAKAAGLLTPLTGKSPEQKEKILKGLATHGIPLPEAKTASEKKIIDKVRADLGMPPEPKSASMKEKYAKAQAQGIMTPLEGKTPTQKENILKAQAEAGIALPEGRTPSEKALINKVKAAVKGPSSAVEVGKIPSEKLRKAKAAGLLTPLEGKTPAQKEKILKGLAKSGIPLPEGKTPSEKEMIRKVTKDLGLPPEPKSPSVKERIQKAQAAGIITPLEGKTPAQKEKILKSMAQVGVPLPEGRTASEKALISKTQAEIAKKPSKKGAGPPTPLSKEAQILDQKTAKVMKEGKGPSDECICPILTPESDKGSVKPGRPSVASKIQSEKLKKAKAAGLLTPLEGKSAAQKEKILKGLAETGIPLPEGKTPSEKALVQKVKTEYGIPKAVTPSEKEVVRKAKAEGLLSPLTGKTAAQKEKTLKGLAEAGLPMPEGKTASEKELIKKVRTAAGLSPEATPSEKLGKVKTKSKKVGAAASKRIAKGVGGSGIAKAGIAEEFEDVLKTTTCDRGCGCDKKKIRFKHSYVKIRVTSPDISSLCPCPEECVPGVKGGVFVDNEGIKVTVGSALGFPLFSIENENKISYKYDSFISTNSSEQKKANPIPEVYDTDNFKIEYINTNMKASYSNDSLSTCAESNDIYGANIHKYYLNDPETRADLSRTSTSRYLLACSESYTSTSEIPSSFQDTLCNVTSKSSLNSIEITKTESSLSFSTKSSASVRTISIISFHNSSITSRSSHYLCYQFSRSTSSINAEDSEYFTNIVDYSAMDSLASQSDEVISNPPIVDKKQSVLKPFKKEFVINEPYVFRMSQINVCNSDKSITTKTRNHSRKSYNSKHNPIIIINELNNDEDIIAMVDEILAKKEIANASSIFVVVPTSDEYDTDITDSASSTICIRISENFFDWKNSLASETSNPKRSSSKKAPVGQGLKICTRAKQYFTECSPKSSKVHDELTETIFERTTENKQCQVNNIVELVTAKSRAVSMDTTQDRPCCCSPREPATPDNYGSNDRFVANAFSELITPMLINQGVSQGLSQDAYLNVQKFNETDYKSFNLSSNRTLSVAPCDIPPCSTSSGDCHEIIKPSHLPRNGIGTQTQYTENSDITGLKRLSPSKACKCGGKVQNTATPSYPGNVQSAGGRLPKFKTQTSSPAPIDNPYPYLNQGVGEHPCSNCGRPTMKDGRKISCLCSGSEKKIQFPDLCPCEAHRPPVVSTGIGPNRIQSRSIGDQYIQNDTPTTNQSPCACKNGDSKRGKKKNIICECPQVEEEPYIEEEFNYVPEIDEKENRKMKSDQTQTTSGFKFNVRKRPSLEEEMSFEDALKYFEENPTEGDGTQVNDSCFCDENGMSVQQNTTGVNCECPYEELGAEVPPEGPFTGLKIHIGGKGSGSKGLSGICCFDVVQESNGLLLLHD